MKRKIIASLIAVLGSVVLFFVGCAVVMFLAPGTEIFGVRYVASGLSQCDVKQTLESFSGDVYVETSKVPIQINFGNYNYGVEFRQNFIGFTKSKDKKASLSVSYDQSRNLHIKANEIQEFVYSQKSDPFYHFVLNLPHSYFNDGNRSITIKSKSSSVQISGNANLKNFTVETNGALSFGEESKVLVKDVYKCQTNKLVEIGENIECFSADIYSTGNSIIFKKPMLGNIKAKTKGGDLKFISCENLEFHSTSGSVKTYGEGLNEVRKNVYVSTNGGSVQLGNINSSVYGLAQANIDGNAITTVVETVGGSIKIAKMHTGEVRSSRGRINVDEAIDITLEEKTGDIVIKKVLSRLVVKGRNGRVTAGEDGAICNPQISTTSGVITVYNSSGDVIIKSSSNNVTLVNSDSQNINLHSGKNLVAENLMGNVEAYAKGNIDLFFKEFSGDVKVSTGTKAKHVEIDLLCSKLSEVNYDLKSTKSKKAKVYVMGELVDEGTNLASNVKEGKFGVSVETSYAVITLKLGE